MENVNPNYCWQCGKRLELNGRGEWIYKVYIDPIGNRHNVHKICHESLRRPVTAQPRVEP